MQPGSLQKFKKNNGLAGREARSGSDGSRKGNRRTLAATNHKAVSDACVHFVYLNLGSFWISERALRRVGSPMGV